MRLKIMDKLNIGIVGVGVVGSACEYGFKKLGHNVVVHDIILNTHLKDVLNTDVVFLCVPSPPNKDGACDTSIIENIIKDLAQLKYKGIIAIKTTVEPGTTHKLRLQYDYIKGHMLDPIQEYIRICFVPEFLRERCAISDFTEHHDLLAIGTDDVNVFNTIVKCHGKYPKAIVMLSSTEAELLKYYSNIFNALRVVFANEMYDICTALNANYSQVKAAFMMRGTATDMYMDVNENFRGFGGVCLNKDNKAMAQLVKKLNLDLNLFACIDEENKKFKTTVFDGMRIQ